MEMAPQNPPWNGEGDRAAERRGGGGPRILQAPIKVVKRARRLRKQLSLPEVLLWQELRKRPGGFKFRKQFPQLDFSIDFACLAARLAIEVDGEAHDRGAQPAFDSKRDERLRQTGFTMMRIPAREVLTNIEGVVAGIVARCNEAGPHHRPSGGPPPRSGEDGLSGPNVMGRFPTGPRGE